MNFYKSAFYVLGANALVFGLSLLLRSLTARVLGPLEYGLFALVLGTATVLSAFTRFSFDSGVLYFTAKNPGKRKEIVSSVIAFIFVISAVLFIPLQYAVLLLVPGLGFAGYAISFLLSVTLSLFTVLQATQQGLERFREYGKYNVLSSLAAGLLSLAVAYYFRNGFSSAFARAVAIFFVSLSGLLALKVLGKFEWSTLRKISAYAGPLGFAGLVAALISVGDRYLLAAFRSPAEVGFYDIAYSMVAAILPFSGALLTTVMPRLIKQQQNFVSYYRKLSQANTLILSVVGLFFFFYSDIIVTLLLGVRYQPAALPFKLLSLALPLMSLYGLTGASLESFGKTKLSGLLAASLTIFSIAFNFYLIPSFGALGAAAANFFTYLVVVGVGVYYLRKKRSIVLNEGFRQYLIFLSFAVFYFALAEKGGFVVKSLLYLAFLAVSLIVNKPLVLEVILKVRALVGR